jgi:hypothetical protein
MKFDAPRPSSLAIMLVLSLASLGGFARSALAEPITVAGTLTGEGVECPAMRGDDGKLYSLTPKEKLGLTAAGMRIRVEGTVAEMSLCQQGVTIEVTKAEPAK